jgi:PTH1 family peptidyl-tRNA hydrolase
MKLIVGLGNPGDKYKDSRHNIGFAVVRALADGAVFKKDNRACVFCAKVELEGQPVVLALPLTFMNLSGQAVLPLSRKFCRDLTELLVVVDDLDLELGRLKIRPNGSSGGHHGLASIIESLGSREFARLRLGIGRPQRHVSGADYVLSNFLKKEKETVCDVVRDACDCCSTWAAEGVVGAMEKFNRKK